jgi:exodeoxyribonuclease VII small subunit
MVAAPPLRPRQPRPPKEPMAKPSAKDSAAPARFETAMAELEKIVAAMEAGQLSLEESLENYRRGAELLTLCQGQLQAVQTQVKVLEDGLLKDFTLDAVGARVRPGVRGGAAGFDDAGVDVADSDDDRD